MKEVPSFTSIKAGDFFFWWGVMGRILFFVILFLVIFFAWKINRENAKKIKRKARVEIEKIRTQAQASFDAQERQREISQSNEMAECEVCGAYFELSKGENIHGHHYCSKECAKRA